MPHRNSYGVEWKLIVAYFQKLGYLVFQIGNNPIEHIAPHYNCPTKDMLMYMCKGADLVIALDSGVAQISVALGTPTIIMAGSVDITLRYSNFEKIGVVQGDCPKSELKNCYHNSIGTTGVKCVINESTPPCSLHNVYKIIEQANKLLNK
jgi:ADP-heptose:LPS heptosyltransferase